MVQGRIIPSGWDRLSRKAQRLTGLECEKIDAEYSELLKTIAWLKDLLASEVKIPGLIKTELADLKARFADERRTEIIESTGELATEDLIPKEDDVIMITNSGYIKRIAVDAYINSSAAMGRELSAWRQKRRIS
ncbi:MAG: hypothetical protein Q8N79_10150 [Candidatus Methanoperedens sp.]|nr:hypothetical protein [Candidatus Methanoperedens sp.]